MELEVELRAFEWGNFDDEDELDEEFDEDY